MYIDSFDSYLDFFQEFDRSMTNDLGQLKTKEIYDKIINSSTIKKLGETVKTAEKMPHGQNIIEAVMSMRQFMFSRKEVVLYAAILSFTRILNDAAEEEIRFSEEGMLQVAKQILLAAGKI